MSRDPFLEESSLPLNLDFEVNQLMSTIDDPVLVFSLPLFEGSPFHRNLPALRTSSTVPDPKKLCINKN